MTLPGGPDLFTLRAWLSVERALEDGAPVDDAAAFLQDAAAAVFGVGVFPRLGAFLADQPDGGDLGVLLADDARLAGLLALLRSEGGAPGPDGGPDEAPPELVWSAVSPRHTRQRLRRAAGLRRRAVGMLQPRRSDVAGERRRRQRD